MPQIYLKMSPWTKLLINHAKEFDEAITELIVSQWDVPKSDIAFSAEVLIYARGEADIQIEIRYTAGTDEYNRGRPFDPDEEKQRLLSATIINAVKDIIRKKTVPIPSVSVWTKPFYKGTFVSV